MCEILHKLKHRIRIQCILLCWLTDYLNHRRRVIVIYELNAINRAKYGAWKNTRLSYRSTLFCLTPMTYQKLSHPVINLCMYTDDTTIYFIGSITIEEACCLQASWNGTWITQENHIQQNARPCCSIAIISLGLTPPPQLRLATNQ